jgi:hypothetical protein
LRLVGEQLAATPDLGRHRRLRLSPQGLQGANSHQERHQIAHHDMQIHGKKKGRPSRPFCGRQVDSF